MKQRKVNEVFTFRNVKLKVLESNKGCKDCYLDKCNISCGSKIVTNICGFCDGIRRNDENNVIFKKV